jgi:SNF2 family DNA or RNA helicase
VIIFAPLEATSDASLLNELAGRTDDSHAMRAFAIETAYEAFAVNQPPTFLMAHGLFTPRPTTEDEFAEDPPIDAHKPTSKFLTELVAYKHQVEEARRIVEHFTGNAIVVHEVGLGKTITAILVLGELLLRDPHLTSLTIVPTNLLKQWQVEFSKCIELPIYSGSSPREVSSQPHVLMAIDTAKEPRWEKILTKRNWGFVIVDEGHALRHDDIKRYRFVYSLWSRYRVLLTATPVHNSAYDIYHQVNIVRPGLLGRKAVFGENYMRDERQVSDAVALRERLDKVVSRVHRADTGIPFPDRQIEHMRVKDRSAQERELYDDMLSVLRGIYRRHLGGAAFVRRPSGKEQGVASIVLVAILVLRELASHPLAAIKTMSGQLLKRVAGVASVTGDTTDLAAVEKLVKKYSEIEWGPGSHAKTDALINALPDLIKKNGRVIVYVEFTETLNVIVKRLQKKRQVGLPSKTAIISYRGDLHRAEKIDRIDRFGWHEPACLISTDAGGQGLNLQKANVVVNFDFPWNPMRVEQRIGRVDRLGQTRTVFVRNLITVGTIEQYVYNTLRLKLKVCDDVLGHLIPRIFKFRGIKDRYCSEEDLLGLGQIILSSKNEEDLRRKFAALDDEIDQKVPDPLGPWRPASRWIDE